MVVIALVYLPFTIMFWKLMEISIGLCSANKLKIKTLTSTSATTHTNSMWCKLGNIYFWKTTNWVYNQKALNCLYRKIRVLQVLCSWFGIFYNNKKIFPRHRKINNNQFPYTDWQSTQHECHISAMPQLSANLIGLLLCQTNLYPAQNMNNKFFTYPLCDLVEPPLWSQHVCGRNHGQPIEDQCSPLSTGNCWRSTDREESDKWQRGRQHWE